MKINGYGTVYNLPLLPIDFSLATTLHSKFIWLKRWRTHHLSNHCHRFFGPFSFQSSQMQNIFTFGESITLSAMVCLLCLPLIFSSSSFSLLSYNRTLSRSLSSECTIINLSPTMHKIHTFARFKSVNNNQLFLFVAALLAKSVSFACLRSLFLCVCVSPSFIQRTFKLGIEVFDGGGGTLSRYRNDQTGSLLPAKFTMSLVSQPA